MRFFGGMRTVKILIGSFLLEANENIPVKTGLDKCKIFYGEECIKQLFLDYVQDEDIDLVPSIYANGGSSGVMEESCFNFIEETILKTIKNNIRDLDGIYLHLHGASFVERIGSGEQHLMHRIREVVGPYLPVAVVCDPHGNLTKDYVENTTIIRSYRESPHTDIRETVKNVFSFLVKHINKRQNITPVYRKLPLILGGEQSVSADEPVRTINNYMNKLEESERLQSVSWHVGYIRHDCQEAGCGVVVVPTTEEDQSYAEEVADKLKSFIWNKRHEFHYTGLSMKPDLALTEALSFEQNPVFITDSGDNITSGAMGWNTSVLRDVLSDSKFDQKKFLFAAITDESAYQLLEKKNVNDKLRLSIGKNFDNNSLSIEVDVEIIEKGKIIGAAMFGEDIEVGGCVTIRVEQRNVDVIIIGTPCAFVEQQQFIASNIDWDNYDVIVVKEGYIFPELKEKGKLSIMSLTEGATLQDTSSLKLKKIMRPMFPIDNI